MPHVSEGGMNKMQESLKRDLNKTYLVFNADKEEYEESYELEMILKNAPATILPLRVMRMDGKVEISYDISSKQTLKEFMLRGNLPGNMVRELFAKLVMLGEDMKNYLLDIENVLLDPEHIYRKEESFCFCYCPWVKNDSTQMIRKLLEELLGKLDYSDAKGIELAYHLYQASCAGDFDIEKILREHMVEPVKPVAVEEEVFVHRGMEEPETEPSLWSLPGEEEEPEKKEKIRNFRMADPIFYEEGRAGGRRKTGRISGCVGRNQQAPHSRRRGKFLLRRSSGCL